MAFRERTRQFWLEVAQGKCQFEWYSERDGFVECGERAAHVHHIVPEGLTASKGDDPEENVGMPLCKHHHMNFQDQELEPEEHSRNFSFHPDMGMAGKQYRQWKAQAEHIRKDGGRAVIDYSTSPFSEAARDHGRKIKKGERYLAGTDEIDQYYIEKMRNRATRYIAETGNTKPKAKESPKTDRNKKWWKTIYEAK